MFKKIQAKRAIKRPYYPESYAPQKIDLTVSDLTELLNECDDALYILSYAFSDMNFTSPDLKLSAIQKNCRLRQQIANVVQAAKDERISITPPGCTV